MLPWRTASHGDADAAFLNVPVKDDLVRAVREAVSGLVPAAQVEVNLVEMDQQERAVHSALTRRSSRWWIGCASFAQ